MNNSYNFVIACEKNDIILAKKIIEKFNITLGNELYTINAAFFRMCEYGYFDMIKWFINFFELNNPKKICLMFKLKLKNIHKKIRIGFHIICAHGYFEIVKYFYEQFNLTIYDVKSDNWYPLFMACSNNHLNVVEWLINTFNFTFQKYEKTFRYIFESTHSEEIKKFLINKF
jgi:hypothetical protein